MGYPPPFLYGKSGERIFGNQTGGRYATPFRRGQRHMSDQPVVPAGPGWPQGMSQGNRYLRVTRHLGRRPRRFSRQYDVDADV